MGEKRRWGNWDQSKRDDSGRWPSKSPRHWGQQNQAGFRSWREDERSGKLISNGWEDSYYTAPSWERTFCSYVCRVPWRKICDADRVLYIYKNIAKWDDSAGREAFQNAKARYWAKINHLPCNIPLPDPYMYIDKVDFDTFIDPELAADVERSFVNPPDTDIEPLINHLDSLESKPVPVTGCGEAEQSSSNWDKYIEKPVPASLWDDMGVKNGWGNGTVQCDSWQSRRNHSMYVNGKEASHRVSWTDQDESWRHHESWKNGQDRRNNSWNQNSRYPVDDDQMNSSWKCSGRNSRNNPSFEKVQPHKTWQRGQFLVSRNHQRTGYSGPQFQPENAVS